MSKINYKKVGRNLGLSITALSLLACSGMGSKGSSPLLPDNSKHNVKHDSKSQLNPKPAYQSTGSNFPSKIYSSPTSLGQRSEPPTYNLAQVNHKKPNLAMLNKNKTNLLAAATQPQLTVQNFEHNGLNVQFRYSDRKLIGIKMQNNSRKAMKLDVLNESYSLAPGQAVVIDPPKVKYMRIKQQPQPSMQTAVGSLLKNRFSTSHLYELPKGNE